MSKLNIQGIVFDADGTLFDTERLAMEVWIATAREMQAPAAEEHYLELIGRNHSGIVSLLQQVCPADFPLDDFLLTCSQRSRERLHRNGVPVKNGARSLLAFCQKRGLPVAMATSSGRPTTQFKLENSGLEHYFQTIITGDMVSRGKPDPEIYLAACQAVGTEPGLTLAVEDSKNGILSAHAAGMPTVMIPDLLPATPELERLLFQKFESLSSLEQFLAEYL